MKTSRIVLVFCLLGFSAFGQEKRKIDHTAYNEWKSIRSTVQSRSGAWVAYEVAPMEGDALLILESIEKGTEKHFPRGKSTVFMKDEAVAVFLIEPEFDTLRKLKLADTPKDKLPKDSLAIHWIDTDSTLKIANVKSFQIAEDGEWIAYLSTKDLRPKCPEKQSKRQKKKNPCIRPETSGFTLTLYHPAKNITKEFHGVTSYQINKNGTTLAYVKSHKGETDTLSLMVVDLSNFTELILLQKRYAIPQVKFDDGGKRVAILSSSDTNKLKNFELHCFSPDQLFYMADAHRIVNFDTLWPGSRALVDSLTSGMPAGWTVSEHGRVYFSENGKRIFLGTNEIIRQEPEDTLLENEKAQVDVWGAYDARIQPQQLTELSGDEKKTYLAYVDVMSGQFVQLATPEISSVRLADKGNAEKSLAINDQPYLREATWEYPWKSDYYLLDMATGNMELLKAGQGFTASLSPNGKYFVYYSGLDSAWYGVNTLTKTTQKLTGNIRAVFATDNNGNPSLADEEGFVGWTLINNSEYALVNSRYDIWALNPADPGQNFSLSGENGIKAKIRFAYNRMDWDSTYTTIENNLLIGVDERTKRETIYGFQKNGNGYKTDALLSTDHRITLIMKAEESDRVILRRMSFTEYPDLEKTTMAFEELVKFSDINPQQKLYNWGTVEMVSWTSFEGRKLRGLLYKPEDFDSTKSYPMIVYFYERYTDDIHVYYAPKPTASIIYPTEYVSNGYIIFIPDIEYTPGYPAKSAYDCIVSGTDYLTQTYDWIDSTRLGLQGQSWGGYQTAQLITMTNKYKAAMAGAPVSNMTSAYGGIRWGSGLSRMFQYERTQSRIGYTLWEKPELYMINSPVFGLPNVSTPLLIMSNDGDGAVPWYQGIELYMGLRRLGKPVWLLNYNGDEHNLMQLANKKDLSIRMRQFFDYYLLGAPMPVWMSAGVPATQKGSTYGFELENVGN
jgi:dipeptidyl aminopeptidase/acylaminoacyl peptidase